MKKRLLSLLMLLILLCGCALQNQPSSLGGSETEAPAAEPDDSAARIAYYEELVASLQQELLAMKTDFYVSRVEYEERIAALEAEKEASAEGGTSTAADFRYLIKNGGVTITAYVGSSRQVTVPAEIEGLPVVAIGDRAFADAAKLTSAVLPEGVTDIGWFAFSGCVSLEKVTLPASVAAIAYGAFQNCPSSMTLICASGSYAEQYAVSYGIRVG